MAVVLETSLGDITIDLMTDDRPRASLNFLKLCKIKYYNMCLFHTVQRNLMAQTGDPTGTGKGGQSIFAQLYGDQAAYFEAEMKPRIKHLTKGLVSMVNDGNNMHGSQFFITLVDGLDYLDQQNHTVFGTVSEGLDVLDKLNEIYCDKEGKPLQNIRILHTIILDDPFGDPKTLEVPPSSPVPNMQELSNGRLEYDEEIDPFKGKTEEEVQEIQAAKQAKANAQILEMIGDLPHQDVAPEDNVLFVCKLNPVTTDDDLEIIFSRFGPIKCCEVIRDYKTKESLQYAFIEFEKAEHCENAYFKMDNVLIDDRRIHVDFSQSVSKVKWKGKGKGVQTFDEKTKSSNSASGQMLYGMNFDDWTSGKKFKPRNQLESNGQGKDLKRGQVQARASKPPRRSRSRSQDKKYESFSKKDRSRSKDRKRSLSTDRKHRSRSKDRKQQSQSRERKPRSRSRDRENRSRSRDRKQRSRSRDRKHRSRSRDKKHRSRSRDRKHRSRSRDRKRRS